MKKAKAGQRWTQKVDERGFSVVKVERSGHVFGRYDGHQAVICEFSPVWFYENFQPRSQELDKNSRLITLTQKQAKLIEDAAMTGVQQESLTIVTWKTVTGDDPDDPKTKGVPFSVRLAQRRIRNWLKVCQSIKRQMCGGHP